MDLTTLTREEPAPGVHVWQPRRGYRYGTEVYLLADFALRGLGGRPARVVELGAGSGVVSLLLAAAGVEVVAVEREPRWIALARRSVEESGLGRRVRIVEADARTWAEVDADLVVTNPPWFDPATGPVSPDPWRAAARTSLHGTPEDLVQAGLRLAPRVCVVGPRRVTPPPGSASLRRARHGRILLDEVGAGPASGEAEEVDIDAAWISDAYARWRPRP